MPGRQKTVRRGKKLCSLLHSLSLLGVFTSFTTALQSLRRLHLRLLTAYPCVVTMRVPSLALHCKLAVSFGDASWRKLYRWGWSLLNTIPCSSSLLLPSGGNNCPDLCPLFLCMCVRGIPTLLCSINNIQCCQVVLVVCVLLHTVSNYFVTCLVSPEHFKYFPC